MEKIHITQKIYTSLGCKNCHSSNIEYSIEYLDEKISIIKEENAKIITRQKNYNCKCNNCGHNYIIEHGIERYVLFEKPCPINCLGDINILATFETESGFELNYKICSTTYSPYEGHENLKELTYMMLIEGEEYPVIISKQTVEEMIKEPSKARRLVINTIQSRHR